MSAFSNKSSSHYWCVEATLPFSAVAQRLRISNILHNAQIDLQTHVLRLEIDFIPVYCEGYYGTGIGESDEEGMVLMECASESGGYHGGRADGAD